MGIQGREVKQSHAVYHEAGQMVGRQTVAQPHCQIERLGVVHIFECSTHAQEYTITDGGYVLLSDKLLVGQSQNLWKSAQKQRVGQSQQIWIKCRIVSRFITSSLNIFAKKGHFGAS